MPEIPVTSPSTTEARSFGPSPRATAFIVAALLVLIAVFLFASVRQESQTFDESSHLLAGFEYWKHGDFGRNPEHPPLVKFLAALPLLPMGLKEPPVIPIPYFKGQDLVNGVQLLYTANADAILLRGRTVVAFFSLALALLVFFAAREMFSPLAGVLALGLFAFEPVLLANGALVTTDMPLACLFFAAVYAFYRYIKRPSALRLALCAAASALAITAKHSGVLILPTLALIGLADVWLMPREPSTGSAAEPTGRCLRRLVFALLIISLASYIFLWGIYGFRYAARPGQLAIAPTLAEYTLELTRPAQRAAIGFLARHHLFPEAYLFGWVDILLIPGTRPTFLLGHVLPSGKWFFFPVVFLIKTTLTLMIFLLLVPFARIRDHRREFLFLAIPSGFFFLVAVSSMLNLGVRHIITVYPFCIVLASAAAAAFVARSLVGRIAVAALLLLTVVSSLHSFPDYLAYSNEAAGGPSRTYRLVTDTNADWGQGLKWAKVYLDHHPTSECWFAYPIPLVSPTYYGIQCKPLPSGLGHLIGFGTGPLPQTISGTVFVSATEASGLMWGPDTLNPYRIFWNRKPDAAIGNVILVYNGTFDLPLLAAQSNAVEAIGMMRRRRLPEAVALATTAAHQAPDSAEVNAVLGEVLLASGRAAEGQQAIANAIHLAQTIYPESQKYLVEELQHP